MTELDRKTRDALSTVRAHWGEADAHAAEQAVRRRIRRRAATRRIGGAAVGVLLLVAGAFALLRAPAPAPASPPMQAKASRSFRFSDGSVADPIGISSVLHVAADTPTRAVVEVATGSGRFTVKKNPARVFRVEAGAVTVEDLGTIFSVERVADRARVSVEEGQVRVSWRGGERTMAAGEAGLFPPEAAPATVAPAKPSPSHRAESKRSWRELAEDGEYDAAWDALGAAAQPSDEPGDLLLAADVARLSHHPAEAVTQLRKVIRDHANDPRAPLAAFTLGRVLLEALGEPREAAEAFARAEELAPDGPLAQDAIAREVEALSRAGETAGAHARAVEYLRRYPDGRRLHAVKRFGGID